MREHEKKMGLGLVMRTAESSVVCVTSAVGHSGLLSLGSQEDADYGEVGTPVEDSRYCRDYCYLCSEPIRVPLSMLGLPNACSGCQPDYRGKPGVVEAERNFWSEQYELAEVISGEES